MSSTDTLPARARHPDGVRYTRRCHAGRATQRCHPQNGCKPAQNERVRPFRKPHALLTPLPHPHPNHSLLNDYLQRRGGRDMHAVELFFEERDATAPRAPVTTQAMDRRPREARAMYRAAASLKYREASALYPAGMQAASGLEVGRSRWHAHKEDAKKEACGALLRLLEAHERLFPTRAEQAEELAMAEASMALVLLRGAQMLAGSACDPDGTRRAQLAHISSLLHSPSLWADLAAGMSERAALAGAAPKPPLLAQLELELGEEECAQGDPGARLQKWVATELRSAGGNAYVAADTVLPTLGLVAQAEIDAFHRDNDRL